MHRTLTTDNDCYITTPHLKRREADERIREGEAREDSLHTELEELRETVRQLNADVADRDIRISDLISSLDDAVAGML